MAATKFSHTIMFNEDDKDVNDAHETNDVAVVVMIAKC